MLTSFFVLAAAGALNAAGLVGRWTAERTYGAHMSAATIVLARGRSWTATVHGMRASAVDSSTPVLTFAGGSELRVRLSGGPTGQWIQPGNADDRERIASPVAFRTGGRERWLGTIRPLSDVQHLELFVQRAPDGTLSAFMRNPEQNAGARIGLRSVVLSGDTVRLQRQGSADISGRWSAARSALTFENPGLPGTFSFTRYKEPAGSDAYRYRRPPSDGDGWRIGTLPEVGIDDAAITHIVDGIRNTVPTVSAPYVQSLLIARHGKLVLDEYFNAYDASRPHDVRSAGKSVTTLLVARAIEETKAFSAQTPIAAILTKYAPFANDDQRKQRISVGNLMSMSAGYACDENDDASPGGEDRMQTQTAQPDWYKFTLDLPMLFEPGTRAIYCSAQINLLGAVIAKETGSWLPDYFYDRFAGPMQFQRYGLWLTPPPLTTAYMAGGDLFRPRDFLKFGQLFLNQGTWNGKRILGAASLAELAAKHAYLENNGDYGYGWHLLTFDLHGRTVGALNAGGNGGQLLYVVPQLDMAVMITAANYGQYPVWKALQTDLMPRVMEAAGP